MVCVRDIDPDGVAHAHGRPSQHRKGGTLIPEQARLPVAFQSAFPPYLLSVGPLDTTAIER